MSLRVAMVGACPYPVPQGSQTLLRDTALALTARGHHVRLVVYGYGEGADASGLPVDRCLRIPGARKTAAGPSFAKPALDLALVMTLRRVIRRERIDIVHAHNYEGLAVALAAGKRPVVYHAHNALQDELPYYFGGARWATAFGATLDKALPRRANHSIAPHQRLADYLAECGCAPDAISVIAPAMAPWPAREPTPGAGQNPAILYSGNLDSYQNLPFLRTVMERVRAARPDARLRVVSSQRGPFPEAEMVYAESFQTTRDELSQDCIVVCPRVSWSGYPIKLLNAMAAGRPIVACESAAYPLVSEQTGLIVRDNDAEAFTSAVIRLMDDSALRTRLGADARSALLRNHAPDETAQTIERVYCRLLGRS